MVTVSILDVAIIIIGCLPKHWLKMPVPPAKLSTSSDCETTPHLGPMVFVSFCCFCCFGVFVWFGLVWSTLQPNPGYEDKKAFSLPDFFDSSRTCVASLKCFGYHTQSFRVTKNVWAMMEISDFLFTEERKAQGNYVPEVVEAYRAGSPVEFSAICL